MADTIESLRAALAAAERERDEARAEADAVFEDVLGGANGTETLMQAAQRLRARADAAEGLIAAERADADRRVWEQRQEVNAARRERDAAEGRERVLREALRPFICEHPWKCAAPGQQPRCDARAALSSPPPAPVTRTCDRTVDEYASGPQGRYRVGGRRCNNPLPCPLHGAAAGAPAPTLVPLTADDLCEHGTDGDCDKCTPTPQPCGACARLRGVLDEARQTLAETVGDGWPVLMGQIDAALSSTVDVLALVRAEAERSLRLPGAPVGEKCLADRIIALCTKGAV
jgi:hypothetical protein